MHLAQRAYILIVVTGVLGIAGTWSSDPKFAGAWHWPALVLLVGLAVEAVLIRRTVISVAIVTGPRARLGREQGAAFAFSNDSDRPVTLEYAPVLPAAFEPVMSVRRYRVAPHATGQDALTLLPVRLGRHSWLALSARLYGRFGLIWWPRELPVSGEIVVTPDVVHARGRPRGMPSGLRPRRAAGAGSELHQLRAYAAGDPLARIDWKATARIGRLVTREFSEDQHLDILVVIDAGRASRIRAGRLDRLGLYANIAARLAEVATPNDDRVGLVVYSDRTLAACAPARGLPAVTRLRTLLAELRVEAAESDAVAAAVRVRALLKHRSLIVLLTDLGDPNAVDPLARAVRLLSPPHIVVLAGVLSPEIAALARRQARGAGDAWESLAALEQQMGAATRRAHLRALGAPVIATRERLLERAVLSEYERLRRTRRV